MKTYLKKQTLAAAFSIGFIAAQAQVGTLVQRDTVPVQSSIGVGIDVDCVGNLYYTNYTGCDNHLYRMDKDGNLLSTVLMVDSLGNPVSVGAISWDNNRDMIWGGSQCGFSPTRVFLINPVTGLAQYKFDAYTPGNLIDDGIAYDFTDHSLWITPDVSQFIDHYKEDGTYLGTLYPSLPASICTSCNISGVVVGQGDMLYLGLDGLGKIVQVKKSDGSYLSSFSSPGGRDEDLACDNVNFLPKLVLWSKDAYNNTVDAIEVTPETCKCSEVTEGINENENGGVSVYFNPAENNISVKASTPFKNAQVEVWNMLGARVYSQHLTGQGEQSIAINVFPGVYFVRISDGERIWMQKVMIEK